MTSTKRFVHLTLGLFVAGIVLFAVSPATRARAQAIAGYYLTNGQILIGSTGAAPVAATLTGTSNQVTVTSGAGTITLSLPSSLSVSSITAVNAQVSASTGPAGGATGNFRGVATTAQIALLPGQQGDFIINSSYPNICVGSGTTATPGAWVLPSTGAANGVSNNIPCHT